MHIDLNTKFLIRLDDQALHKEIEQLTSDDEIMRLYLNNKRTKPIIIHELKKKMKKKDMLI